MIITPPERLQVLPPYLFVEIDHKKRMALEQGVDVIDLGVGDPDLPTPEIILKALRVAAGTPENHFYPLGRGRRDFRLAVSEWFGKRFQVNIDPEQEVLCLIGSKEGIGHAPLAYVNPGEIVLIPEPAYPVYYSGTVFAGAEPMRLPLRRENNFRPDLQALSSSVLGRTKLLFLNYPNNPTAAVADLEFFEELIAWCQKHEIILVHDMAYSEIYFEGEPPPSVLQIPGAREVAIEMHSFSKSFSMAGWRIGFAVGRRELIEPLARIKGNLDSGTVSAVQVAAKTALKHAEDIIPGLVEIYRHRRDVFVAGLQDVGFKVDPPKATFYVWCPVPEKMDSTSFATQLLEKAGVVAAPGIGFGSAGEGFIRFSLTSPEERLMQAVDRIKTVGWK